MSDGLIELKGVTKHFDQIKAVNDLSLTVAPGNMLVLLGRSGCGKTTILRLIAGLERPDAGEIWLNGVCVASSSLWTPPEKRRIGMVFQDYALFPHLTVRQNIAFALEGMKASARDVRVGELLELSGLMDKAQVYPHQLSGGQQQRVALARALASAPNVVLLDEPFSNLDAALRKQMREEVQHILRAAGATAVFVTHDQEEAMLLADEIAVLDSGQLLQIGQPECLYRYPHTPEIATFLGEANYISGDAQGEVAATALGALPLAHPMQGEVTVMLRPENLNILPMPNGDFTVTHRRYYGHYYVVTICQNSGLTLDARVWTQTKPEVGDRVQVRVTGDVVAFPNRR